LLSASATRSRAREPSRFDCAIDGAEKTEENAIVWLNAVN